MDLRIGRCRVPEYLKKSGMNQAEFARRMELSEGFVSKVMTGEKKLSLTKAKVAADLFGCCIDDLYEWHLNSEGKR